MLRILKSKKFQHFAPFMLLVVGGSFYLREFTEVRYKYRNVTSYDDVKREVQKEGIEMKEPVTLEEEYEKIKELDIDNWENVRIPRPWEETNTQKN